MAANQMSKIEHRHLVLVGYRGSGKTSVGKNLAKILGLDYLDTDIAIQEKAEKSVKEIFADHGESVFRDMETQILEELVAHRGTAQPTVIATGGSGDGARNYSVTGTGCTIGLTSGVLSASQATTCVVTAKKLASTGYNEVSSAVKRFTFTN